jgi:hypothetical protein
MVGFRINSHPQWEQMFPSFVSLFFFFECYCGFVTVIRCYTTRAGNLSNVHVSSFSQGPLNSGALVFEGLLAVLQCVFTFWVEPQGWVVWQRRQLRPR